MPKYIFQLKNAFKKLQKKTKRRRTTVDHRHRRLLCSTFQVPQCGLFFRLFFTLIEHPGVNVVITIFVFFANFLPGNRVLVDIVVFSRSLTKLLLSPNAIGGLKIGYLKVVGGILAVVDN
jgi:hypothetical protein